MKKYPFQPELLDALPEPLAELFRELEDTLLTEICKRLKAAEQLNEVTVQDIRALRSHGIDLKEIQKAIAKTSGVGEQELNQLIDDVVQRNQAYHSQLLGFADVTQPQMLVDRADVEAIRTQTLDTFRNITQSMGFLVDNGRTMLEPAKAYQWALDNAELQIQSGAVNYNQAIKSAVTQLAESGIKTVHYESGHVDQVDVAVRRAAMTGVNQLCARYNEQSAEYLDTPYYEISAHSGARDEPGKSPWASHKDWQGKVYSVKRGDKYPNIYDVCGLGAVDGLEGANCRHIRFPFVDGVSERTYTDEQLAHIDDGLGCTYDGKTYSAYQATQMQRKIERTIRKQKRLRDAYKAAGLEDDTRTANIKLRRLNAKYKEFSKTAKLPEQPERTKVLYTDAKSEAKAAEQKAKIEAREKAARAVEKARLAAEAERLRLQNEQNIAILKEKIDSGEVSTKIRHQVQARHMEGTPEFERYQAQRLEQGRTPQSVLTITEQEAQELVDKYSCTGTVVVKQRKDGSVEIREFTDTDRIIGKEYTDNEYRDTKRIIIFYSKKGVHIVPTNPEEDKK